VHIEHGAAFMVMTSADNDPRDPGKPAHDQVPPPPSDIVEEKAAVENPAEPASPRSGKQTRLDKSARPTMLAKDESEAAEPNTPSSAEPSTPEERPPGVKSATPTMLAKNQPESYEVPPEQPAATAPASWLAPSSPKATQLARAEEGPAHEAETAKPVEPVHLDLSLGETQQHDAVPNDAELVTAEIVDEPSGTAKAPASSDLSDDDILFAEEVKENVLQAELVEPSSAWADDEVIDAEVVDDEIADDDEVLSADEVLVVEPSGSALPVELVDDGEILEAVEVSDDENVLDADEVVVAGTSGSAQAAELLDEDVIEAVEASGTGQDSAQAWVDEAEVVVEPSGSGRQPEEEGIDAEEVIDVVEGQPSAPAQPAVSGAEDLDDLFAVEEVAQAKEPSTPAVAPDQDYNLFNE
jgi:hypothetical protein